MCDWYDSFLYHVQDLVCILTISLVGVINRTMLLDAHMKATK